LQLSPRPLAGFEGRFAVRREGNEEKWGRKGKNEGREREGGS